MKNYDDSNYIPGYVIWYVMGAFFILLSVFWFIRDFEYITTGKTTNLNQYIDNISIYGYEDELPIGDIVNLRVDRCYGLFDSRTVHRRRSPDTTYYYYVVGLNDGSVMMVYAADGAHDDFDRMAGFTLSGEDPNAVRVVGKLKKFKDGWLKDDYKKYINNLISEGILPSDVNVRYVSLTDDGGQGAAIFAYSLMVLIGILLIKLGIDDKNGKIQHKSGLNNYRPLKNKYSSKQEKVYKYEYRPSQKLKYTITYIIFVIVAVIVFLSQDPENRDTTHIVACIIISAVVGLIVSWAFAELDKKYSGTKKEIEPEDVAKEDNRSEAVKYHEMYFSTFMKYGFTEAMLQRADKVIAAYKNGKRIGLNLYKDYIIYPAVYCCLLKDYERALLYLLNISAKTLSEYRYTCQYGTNAVYRYLALEMEAVRGLNDKSLAKAVMEEATPYIEEKYLTGTRSYYKDVYMYHYHMLNEEYDKAKEAAERLLTCKCAEAEEVELYLINTEIRLHFEDRDGADEMMKRAKDNAVRKAKPFKQIYSAFYNKYNFGEELRISKE
ncbi:MAG: hypothetical protein J6O17_08420 [Eubacterium sp.]|nr:hypothetical protein [Eubacterium sp.]